MRRLRFLAFARPSRKPALIELNLNWNQWQRRTRMNLPSITMSSSSSVTLVVAPATSLCFTWAQVCASAAAHRTISSATVGSVWRATLSTPRIVRKLVSPALGSESFARSLNKLLPAAPAWIYANLERWHYLSFLRTANVMEILKTARLRALEPEKIEALITLIDEDLGYHLHQAVQRVKFELSHAEVADFHFRDGSMDLSITVPRGAFESWIAEELLAIEQCVDSLLKTSGISRRQVDRVFLTGGSSLVPAVRRIFETRFGEQRIRTGNEFISVARGLALRAQEVLASS